jgi:hypothetical protein
MKTTFAVLASLLALNFSVSAQDKKEEEKKPAAAGADKPKFDPEAAFKKADANADGSISLDEWKATKQAQKDPTKAEGNFKKKDKDADGKLTLEEYKAHGPGKGGKEGEAKKEEPKKPETK